MLSTSFPKDKKKTVLHLQNARRTAFFVITILNQYESRSNVLTENPKWNNQANVQIKKKSTLVAEHVAEQGCRVMYLPLAEPCLIHGCSNCGTSYENILKYWDGHPFL
jgi:hypothetical protein